MIHTTGFDSDLFPKLESFVKSELDAKRVKLKSISAHFIDFTADGVKGELVLNCLSNDAQIADNDIIYDIDLYLL